MLPIMMMTARGMITQAKGLSVMEKSSSLLSFDDILCVGDDSYGVHSTKLSKTGRRF